MAITLHQEPQQWSTSDNPLLYVFSSDQTAQANFSYIVETYYNAQMVDRRKIFPEQSTKSHWDCSEVIKQRLFAPKLSTDLFTESYTSGFIHIKVIENYGATPVNQAELTTEFSKVFKASLPIATWEQTDFSDYPLQKWLTDVPNNEIEVLPNQNVYLSMIVDDDYECFITTYDSSGVEIASTSFQDIEGKQIVQLNLNTVNLTTELGLTMTNVAYFTVQINESEIITVKYIQDFCYSPRYVVWVNKYGAFDQFVILHNEIENGKIKEFSFEKQYGAWYQGNFVYDSTISGDQNYFKTETKEGNLVTDYITDTVQNWLISIFLSPRVYVFDIDNNYRLIKVTNSSYELENRRFEDLISVEIKYKANNETTSILL